MIGTRTGLGAFNPIDVFNGASMWIPVFSGITEPLTATVKTVISGVPVHGAPISNTNGETLPTDYRAAWGLGVLLPPLLLLWAVSAVLKGSR